MLLDNPKGNYKFLRGAGVPFSAGALADPGFEIVHSRLKPLGRLSNGFELIERQLRAGGRPLNAVCGNEPRIPGAFARAGLEAFNRDYLERITALGVIIDGLNPIARTNVAPAAVPIAESSLYGFYYTVPARSSERPDFVLAGAPEMTSRDGRR